MNREDKLKLAAAVLHHPDTLYLTHKEVEIAKYALSEITEYRDPVLKMANASEALEYITNNFLSLVRDKLPNEFKSIFA